MKASVKLRWCLGLGLPVLAGAFVPLTISPGRGLHVNAACADGTCCAELKSDCIINNIRTPDAYAKLSGGSCSGAEEPLPPAGG